MGGSVTPIHRGQGIDIDEAFHCRRLTLGRVKQMAEAEITPCQSITMSDKKPGAINYLSALPGNNYKEEPTAEGKSAVHLG